MPWKQISGSDFARISAGSVSNVWVISTAGWTYRYPDYNGGTLSVFSIALADIGGARLPECAKHSPAMAASTASSQNSNFS
jgi:hypothetical protein